MAFNDIERKRTEKAVGAFIERRRPPVHIRSKLDFGYRISDQSVEIFEIRPVWDDPSRRVEIPIAKATYVRSRDVWKVYWHRSDRRWHPYPPAPEVETLEEFIGLVEADAHAYFFG